MILSTCKLREPAGMPAASIQRRPLALLYNSLLGQEFSCRREYNLRTMSDRGSLFLFSVLMILAGLGSAVYLVVTGQAGTVDGLFLFLTALLVAVVFGMYVMFVIGRAMKAVKEPAAAAAKTATAAKPVKSAPAPAAQS